MNDTSKRSPTEPAPLAKMSFTELWQQEVGPLRMMQATASGTAMALLSQKGFLVLLDLHGKQLATVEIGRDARTISLSEELETLVVSESGFSHLYDGEGKQLFKKRIVQALYGLISPSGQQFVFVTRDPTVVLTDRVGRAKWTYRNLLKIPTALDVSAEGQTVAFACQDERGEGLAAIGADGTPFDAFMGLDPLQDLVVSKAGDIVVALDKGRGIYCLNCVQSFGIWKGQLGSAFNGVSFADETKQTLLYAKDGLLGIFDEKGAPIWEYHFPFPLLRARISADGRTIFYASPTGRVGCLRSQAGRDLSRLEFIDVSPTPVAPSAGGTPSLAFRKAWNVDFEQGGPGDQPKLRCRRSVDGVEYLTLWSGRDRLTMLNDCGEEIWNNRLGFGSLRDLAISVKADVIMTVAQPGVIGFNLDGDETFRFFGVFHSGHCFGSGTFLLLSDQGTVRYYLNASHFSHILELQDRIIALLGREDGAYLVGRGGVFLVDAEANVTGAAKIAGEATFYDLDPIENNLLIGTSTGEFTIINRTGAQKLRNQLDAAIIAACFHPVDEVLYIACRDRSELVILRSRDNRRIRVPLTAPALFLCLHERGAIVSTTVDEVCLIGPEGIILARYTFPDRVLGLFPARTRNAVYVLAETGLTCLAVTDGSSPVTTGARYVEI
ncbi:MAG: hypothetical protein WA705_18330 [Candidatus Ozemobacteraceae bacterium]